MNDEKAHFLFNENVIQMKPIIPRTYYNRYRHDGDTYLSIWRQWLGRVWDHTRVEVVD